MIRMTVTAWVTGAITGCSLMVGTDTRVVGDAGAKLSADATTAGDGSPQNCSGAKACLATENQCRSSCGAAQSSCEQACDGSQKDVCTQSCKTTGQACAAQCTSSCSACAVGCDPSGC